MSRRNDEVYLRHIRDFAQEAIDILGDASVEGMKSDRLLNLAVLHLMTVLGEAATRVSTPTQQAHPEIPWRDMITMRNRLIHGYDTVVPQTVWETIKNDLPILVESLDAILDKEPEGEA